MSHSNSENKLYGSSNSFQMPNIDHDPSSFGISPSDINMNFWSNGSSFSSSASGSGAGGSFSSVEHLPSISRDFVRPSENDTRRPATAGGALQPSRGMFSSGLEATIQEEEGDNDVSGVNSRRASVPHDSWLNHGSSMPSITPYNQFVFAQQTHQQPVRNTMQVLRPQTSDGLPHHTMVPSLPSLNSHVQYTGTMAPRALPNAMPNMAYSSFPGDRAFSFSGIHPQFVNGNSDPLTHPGNDARKHTFVATDEDRPKAKRPRRRADEITRKYKCGWNGCDKGYGTLNHLNAHVETLKHGEKRTSDEFKWIKEENKTIKQRAAAEAARNKSSRSGPDRGSFSSESDYTRRDSAISGYTSADFSGRSSLNSGYDFMYSRPGTAGSMASYDGNPSGGYADQFAFGGATNRRPSAPMHIPLPPPRPMNQDFGLLNGNGNGNQFLNGDHLTPTNQYPHSHLNLGEYRPPAQTQNSTMAMSSAQPLEKPFEQFSFQR